MGKKLGQHFLKNEKWAELVAAELSQFKTVIEIGPGLGALTEKIVLNILPETNFLAVEKDFRFIPLLEKRFPSVKFIEGDILKVLPDLMREQKDEYAIVGNIPYYLTGFLLREIGDSENRPRQCIFMTQKEVAERICAEEGKMNKLAASVQLWGAPKILASIPRKDFSPPPKVESAIIEISCPKSNRNSNFASVFLVIRSIFAQPRKTLLNNLSTVVDLPKDKIFGEIKNLGLSENSRPQDLDIAKISEIAKKFKKYFDKSLKK